MPQATTDTASDVPQQRYLQMPARISQLLNNMVAGDQVPLLKDTSRIRYITKQKYSIIS
ncbi:hypothetical protein PV327_011507, partial [Microctonus hyperodae]